MFATLGVPRIRDDRASSYALSHVALAGIGEVWKSMTMVDLVEVAERARAGDREAWREIAIRFDDPLRRIARAHGLDGPRCEDVVQQTWVSVFSQFGELRCAAALAGWLYTIARRESRRAVARRNRETVRLKTIDPLDDADEPNSKIHSCQPAPEVVVLRAEQRALLRLAWDQLSERDRELLSLLMDEPRQPYAEISRQTGLPIGSIGPTRARCLARLRTQLEALGVHQRWTAA
jgi:RNA polymerase sigma factor (sigma-70 family)